MLSEVRNAITKPYEKHDRSAIALNDNCRVVVLKMVEIVNIND